METQQTNAGISQLSSMNAFYGIPNVSQETRAALENGAQAPEVYTPGSRESITPEPTQETASDPAPANPVEAYFAQTTEQLELSDRAVAMQQQQQGNTSPQVPQQATYNEPPPASALEATPEPQTQLPETQNSTQPEIVENMGTNQSQPTTAPEPTAATALNTEPIAEPQSTGIENNQSGSGANNQLQASYGQFSDSGPAASNASQPGSLLSATV